MMRIALFGQPGSGKSTIARKLAQKLHCKVIEASNAVIFPIAANLKTLPKEKKLLTSLSTLARKKHPKITREMAMQTFARLKDTYSPDFIARALHELYVEHPKKACIVFSGMRGLDNAKYCRLHNED